MIANRVLVDAHVGKSLFQDAILPLARSGKTVLLVTHAQHFLSDCDYIYTLDDGQIAEQGTYKQLLSNNGEFSRLDKEFGGGDNSAEEPTEDSETQAIQSTQNNIEEVKIRSALRTGAGTGKLEGRLIVKEKRTTGSFSGRGTSIASTNFLYLILFSNCSICWIFQSRSGIFSCPFYTPFRAAGPRLSDLELVHPSLVAG